ncbi:MAG: RagB/SusD family nutrient uptake outer membrane protein [Dysgonamonadaceae bacterium]|jgi:hypothetical protein|nr:RagB/SusD family nutrient uptake outer membrane protein [Dysgonamonadaceae bacterium]
MNKFISFLKSWISIHALVLISFALFFSCSDDDDVNNGGGITTEVIKTNAEALAIGNAVFPPLTRLSSSFSFLIELPVDNTISFEGPEDRGAPVLSRFEHAPKTGFDTPHDYPDKVFSRLYESIGNSNVALEKLDSSRVTETLSQTTKDLVAARVKFTRALSYHYLVQLYGEVPLRLTSADSIVKTRNSIDEIYNQIVKDFTEALEYLPEYDSNKATPTKGAANAILSRVYLSWAGKPLTQSEVAAIASSASDPSSPQWDTKKLEEAVKYADKVINSGNYKLLTDFNRNFGIPGQNGDEHIYTIHHEGDPTDGNNNGQSNHQTHCTFTNRYTDIYADFHIGPADETLLSQYEANDKRRTITYATTLYDSDDGNKRYDWAFPVTSPIYGKWIHRANYNLTPETLPGILRAGGNASSQTNNINRIEIRYAELLLIKAEALLWLGKAGEALPLVNQIRSRAGIASLASLTKEALFNEWDLELRFEQKRWTNLVRWRTLVQTVRSVNKYEYFKEGYKDEESVIATAASRGFTDAETVNAPFYAKAYKHLHAKYDNVRGKHYRFPIPKLSAIDYGIGPQNPGY